MPVSPATPEPLPVALTRQFYEWEQRGRGWLTWDEAVDLEPPFRPFAFVLPHDLQQQDDGRRHTLFSALREILSFWPSENKGVEARNEEPYPEPARPTNIADLVELQVILPPEFDVSKTLAEQFLLSLSNSSSVVAYEIVSNNGRVSAHWTCRNDDANHAEQQLIAHFPDALVVRSEESFADRWNNGARYHLIVDFGLSQEFICPIRCFRNFDSDPLTAIVGALSRLNGAEVGILQILFQPTRLPWTQSIVRSVTNWSGENFFADAPEMTSLARDKISSPLYSVVLRVAVRAESQERCWEIARGIGGALARYANSPSNEFIPLSNDNLSDVDHQSDLLHRQSHRSGMLLNIEELVGLAHLPSASVRSESFQRRTERTRPAPRIATAHDLVLGENCHEGTVVQATLSTDQRVKHVYVIGASGTGKSNFLLHLIDQDLQAGRGVAVLDPHGDLIDAIVERIPEHRTDDVIVFDPADEGYPIAFNVLSAHSEIEKTLLASDLMAVFKRLSTSWGDQMSTVFQNAIAAMLESERGGTLADLRRFLAEKEYRIEFLRTVKDPDIVYYWQKEFPLLSGRPQSPILTRLDAFLRPKLIRQMVAQRTNRVDFADIMDSGKIFLARLSQGAIGEENAYLLGTFLVSKFHQMILSRQSRSESERRPYFLYLDEFHHFVTPSMASILSGVRKYRLGLVLAHQELRQLEKRDAEVASAVLTNPFTRVCFRVGDPDAKKLADGFSHFDASDLLNLGTGEAICRVERSNFDFNLQTPRVEAVEKTLAQLRRQKVKEGSRQRYATPHELVEMELRERARSSITAVPLLKETPRDEIEIQAVPTPDLSSPMQTNPLQKEKVVARRQSLTDGLMGKGGQEHRYLQNFTKRWAEGMGYRATIEKPLGDGCSVDVALEKEQCSIACEISVSTSSSHELGNLKKCLAAGYTYVAILSSGPKKLAEIEKLAREVFAPEEQDRLRFFAPDELFAFIEQLEAQFASTEKTVRGYKVKVNYSQSGKSERAARSRAVSKVIASALRRVRKE